MIERVKSKVDWAKSWVRKWQECRYCHRNVYSGEMVWKLVGAKSPYYVCRQCGEKFRLREEVSA